MIALSGRVIFTHTVSLGSPNNDIYKVAFSYFFKAVRLDYKMKRSILKIIKLFLFFISLEFCHRPYV